MNKKFDLKIATLAMAIMLGVLTLVLGIVFYATFERPVLDVFLPELETFRAWTAVEMLLGVIFIAVAVIYYFALKKKWWKFTLIGVLILAISLEIVLTILLFRNADYIANSIFLLVLSFIVIALYITIFVTLLIENHKQLKENKLNKEG